MSDIRLRVAAPSDAETLSRIGRRTFTETFGRLYPAEDLADFLRGHAPERYAAWLADPSCRLWLAERDGEALGYALAAPCGLPHADVTPDCGELQRLYVDARAQRTGAGTALLREALDWLQAPGRTLWIGVWSENHGAQRLYRRHGFEQVGSYLFPVGASRDLEFILRRPPP
ncbi:MAG: GNAT family N-acetyltransferase [Caulobacteraceae bacterium]|nr:GNAT family N-acetyltransferase [Caulobacteraceae bacterium]